MHRLTRVPVGPFAIALAVLVAGCTGTAWQGIARGLAAGAAGASAASAPKLMLFGGTGHRVYLGCLTCSRYDAGSVFNRYGDHGSPYGTASIFNKYGEYGSRYSDTSACNPYASDPPVIVDGEGKYYGRLTVSRSRRDGPPTPELRAWIEGVCSR